MEHPSSRTSVMERLPPDLVRHLADGWLGPRERAALRGCSSGLRACVAPLTEEQQHHARFWRVLNEMMDALNASPSGRIDDPEGWELMYEVSKRRENHKDVFFMKSVRAYKKPRGGPSSSHPDLAKSYNIYMSPRTHWRQRDEFRLSARLKLVRLFGAELVIEITRPDATVFLTHSETLGGWGLEAFATDEIALDACLTAMREIGLVEPGRTIGRRRVAAIRIAHLQHRESWAFGGPVPYRYRVYGLPGPPEFEAARPRLLDAWSRAFAS